jgi:predicted ATPase
VAADLEPFVKAVILRRKDVPSFDAYPFCLRAVRNLEKLPLDPKVTIFIGENGSGKSTLIEAIAIAAGFNPEGGSKNFNFKTVEAHSNLHDYLTLQRSARREKDGYFLRAESFFNVASNIDELGVGGAYGDASLHAQSHGESFLALVLNRFFGNGLYILDEPEAALSPMRQLSMLKAMHQLVEEKGSQFIMATHSPILMSYPGATLLSLDGETPAPVAWEDTEHVQLTRAFLNKPERFLRELLP